MFPVFREGRMGLTVIELDVVVLAVLPFVGVSETVKLMKHKRKFVGGR